MNRSKKNIGLIPARAGSKRVQFKNIRRLGAVPLIEYTIKAALNSGVFDDVVISTDSEEIAEMGQKCGASVPFLRPACFAEDHSPDIEWISYTLNTLKEQGQNYEYFSILRPTSPFRTPQTIIRAWDQFSKAKGFDSLRAVELCKQHPYKMWVLNEQAIEPLFPSNLDGVPGHSRAYQSLPPIYIQNASLEIALVSTVFNKGSIAGDEIMAFLTSGFEGFDINTELDLVVAEYLLTNKLVDISYIENSYGR